MRNRILFIITLLICICIVNLNLMWIISSLDKQGLQHLGSDLVMALLLILPYLIIVHVIVWNRNHLLVLGLGILAISVMETVAFHTLRSDQLARQREVPGREVQHYGLLAVLVVQWIGGSLLFASAAVYRIVIAIKKGSAQD